VQFLCAYAIIQDIRTLAKRATPEKRKIVQDKIPRLGFEKTSVLLFLLLSGRLCRDALRCALICFVSFFVFFCRFFLCFLGAEVTSWLHKPARRLLKDHVFRFILVNFNRIPKSRAVGKSGGYSAPLSPLLYPSP